jgi:hypothetical protein
MDNDGSYNGNICHPGWFCEAGSGADGNPGEQCAAGTYASDLKYGL